jgi:hypothetical protein
MDEALDVLRQHYRAVHPTKGFYVNREIERLEQYNLTADEYMQGYSIGGVDGGPQEYDWRTLRNQIQRYGGDNMGYGAYLNPDTVAEVTQRVDDHYANQPPEPERGVAGNILRDAIAPRPGGPIVIDDVVPPFEFPPDVEGEF